MFFNKYFFAKVGRRKHTGKFLTLQFYKSLLQFYKKTRESPVYKAVRAILLSKVIYIFLPILSIRALFKKPICTFLYYCYIIYSLPGTPYLPVSRPCAPSSRRRSESVWLRSVLWGGRRCHTTKSVLSTCISVATLAFVVKYNLWHLYCILISFIYLCVK